MTSIYQGLYDLIVNLIYGGQLTTYGDFCATQIATIGSIIVALLPFVVVGLVIKMLFDVWTNFICGGR